jgi:hypothetical protein
MNLCCLTMVSPPALSLPASEPEPSCLTAQTLAKTNCRPRCRRPNFLTCGLPATPEFTSDAGLEPATGPVQDPNSTYFPL